MTGGRAGWVMWPSKMVAYDDVTDNDEMMMIDVMALPL